MKVILTTFLNIMYFSVYVKTSVGLCPCGYQNTDDSQKIFKPLLLCIDFNNGLTTNNNSTNKQDVYVNMFSNNLNNISNPFPDEFHLIYLDYTNKYNKFECSVIISIIKEESPNMNYSNRRVLYHQLTQSQCPGICSPIPIVTVQYDLVWKKIFFKNDINKFTKIALTCSLTMSMILSKLNNYTNKDKYYRYWFILREILLRKLLECNEQKYWKNFIISNNNSDNNYDNNYFYKPIKRKVESVIIWIGSINNIQLIQEQSIIIPLTKTFKNYKNNNSLDLILLSNVSDTVIGWSGTEDIYLCNINNTNCLKGGNNRFNGFIPSSNINYMKIGWRCAQTRPLRTLSHVLLLFDPHFIVILDDDTFLNYHLLINKFSDIIYDNMTKDPIVIGEFVGKTGPFGHLSKQGMFVGGSDLEDNYRSYQQILTLSLISDGLITCLSDCMDNSNSANGWYHDKNNNLLNYYYNNCIGNKPIMIDKQWKLSIKIRLIDYCVNLMASDNTCLHSDHSVTRCFLYGAKAMPIGAVCHSKVPVIPSHVKVGMCFMSPLCNISEQITCHRFKAQGYKNHIQNKYYDHSIKLNSVKKTHSNKGYYRMFSSYYDGNKTDTNPM
eukprot:gene4566-6439_t